ncbi:FtsQ-type POTRA domain-containing protein [Candidatus Nephthysia bennettiae]|uniref:FtsQ-type POTRA domain-containing protein n=1 Tax=Candidatus Nephthysia bennettiae TaxID=3127016 RepID=A0A934K6J0_9BACT|nr:FtsQ-type POTRA domain-containing protein [Candidatus Dormibacteraeota bacterium]MBJ7611355.1 FtsQ-type POTRA domain-containing protein [Candidatus Dormibacteraeota bacterium]
MRRRRRRSSLLPRVAWRSLRRPLPSIRGEAWFRGASSPTSRSRVVDPGIRWRRLLALGLAAFELVVLVVGLLHPALTVRHVDVRGEHRLAAGEVVAASGVDRGGSILGVDPSTVAARLQRSTWVRSSQVSAQLPDRVLIRIDEWKPVAVYQPASGPGYFLSDQAVALGPLGDQDSAGDLLPVQALQAAEPRPGARVLDPRLLTALVNIQRTLPRLIGQDVKVFTVDSCGNLTLVSSRGWQAQFGRMLTGEEIATLHDKVAALRAVAPNVDYNSPDLQTVNVMNPAAVAVRQKSKSTPTPATPTPATPAPTPAPTAGAGPVRIPAASPVQPVPSGQAAAPSQSPACR